MTYFHIHIKYIENQSRRKPTYTFFFSEVTKNKILFYLRVYAYIFIIIYMYIYVLYISYMFIFICYILLYLS